MIDRFKIVDLTNYFVTSNYFITFKLWTDLWPISPVLFLYHNYKLFLLIVSYGLTLFPPK